MIANRQIVNTSTKTGRSLLLAAVSAAFVLMPSSLGPVPSAHAEPNNGGEWDINAYDQCLDGFALRNPDVGTIPEGIYHGCCTYSGGVWNEAAHKCGAPTPGAATSPRPKPPTSATILPRPGENQQVQ